MVGSLSPGLWRPPGMARQGGHCCHVVKDLPSPLIEEKGLTLGTGLGAADRGTGQEAVWWLCTEGGGSGSLYLKGKPWSVPQAEMQA